MENQENQKNEVATTKKHEVDMFTSATLFIPNTEALGRLENAEIGMSVSMGYRTKQDWMELKLEGKETVRCYYMGLREIPTGKKDKDGVEKILTCGAFFSQDGPFIAGQKTIVDAVQNLPEETPVVIKFIGLKKNSTVEGDTMIFKINVLQFKLKPVPVDEPEAAPEPEKPKRGRATAQKGGATV